MAFFEAIPIYLIYIGITFFILLSFEIGFRIGKHTPAPFMEKNLILRVLDTDFETVLTEVVKNVDLTLRTTDPGVTNAEEGLDIRPSLEVQGDHLYVGNTEGGSVGAIYVYDIIR